MTAKKSNYDKIKNHFWLVAPFGAVFIFLFNLYISFHDMQRDFAELQNKAKSLSKCEKDLISIKHRLTEAEKKLNIKRNYRKERIIYIRNGYKPETRKKKTK